MIYFDNNATTVLSPSVRRYLASNYVDEFVNISGQYTPALNLFDDNESNRLYIADFIGTTSNNIFFTSGASESINTILNPLFCQENNITTVISSRLEHSCVDSCLVRLEKYKIKVLFCKHDSTGVICLEHLESLCKNYPSSLVNIISANNETGVLQDTVEIGKVCKKHNCLLHLDMVQMLARLDLELENLTVDFASFSAHKVGGIKGVGFTYVADPELFTPLILGGDQQNLRGGTHNTGGIKSLQLALTDAEHWDNKKITAIRDSFEKSLKNLHPEISINCQDAPRLANTSNVFFPNINGYTLLMQLSKRQIYASLGSSCHGTQPSKVIQQLGHDRSYAESCLRFSFADFNTHEEIDYTVGVIEEAINL